MRDGWLRWRNPVVLGPLVGWGVGVVWWVALMIALSPAVRNTSDGEVAITVFDRAGWAPVAAIPWAVVGLFVGSGTAWVNSRAVPVCAMVGTVAGGAYALAIYEFDGWLALLMQVACLGGALLGMLFGGVWAVTARSDPPA